MKAIKTIFILTLVFVLASCGGPKGDSQKSKEIDFTKIEKIELTCDEYPEYFAVLSDEQKEYVISLWQEGQWVPGHIKSPHPYRFKAGEIIIECTLDLRIFYDKANHRTLFISDEQGDILKSYFQAVSADAIAEISVGMTYSQVCQILMAPGTGAVEGSSSNGAVIYQFNCDDGSKFLISFLLDTEQKVPVVTNITKVDTEA